MAEMFRVCTFGHFCLHFQGVKAEQKEAEAKSLKARLETSEQSAELMKTFSSPQVSYPFVVNSRTVTKIQQVCVCVCV